MEDHFETKLLSFLRASHSPTTLAKDGSVFVVPKPRSNVEVREGARLLKVLGGSCADKASEAETRLGRILRYCEAMSGRDLCLSYVEGAYTSSVPGSNTSAITCRTLSELLDRLEASVVDFCRKNQASLQRQRDDAEVLLALIR